MIYARQIAPEWQESPIFLDGMFPENIVVTGNRDYISRTTAECDRVLDLSLIHNSEPTRLDVI